MLSNEADCSSDGAMTSFCHDKYASQKCMTRGKIRNYDMTVNYSLGENQQSLI